MRTSWLFVLTLVACSSESTPSTNNNTNTDAGTDTMVTGPVDLQIDTYNIALAGIGVDDEAGRRPRLLAELGKLKGDIACLQEVWREADKTAVRDAMKANYPNAVWPKTDRATKVPDEPAATVPCAGLESDLDAAVACLKEKCATADGKVTSTQCAKDQCLTAAATIFAADNKSCYTCFTTNMVSEKIADIAGVCKAPGRGLGFGGESSPMLLSKHPLKNVDTLVLPGCWQQRSVIRATATLANGADVDIYCNHLTPVNDDAFIPYTCPWGGTAMTDKEKWEAEQLLQANKLLAWAASRPKGKVVLLGDINASPKTSDATLQSYGVATLDAISKVYVEALAPSFQPQCTFCRKNPLVHDVENTWLDHVFLGAIDKSAVKSTEVTFTQDPPMSDHYGLRVVVTVAP
jgi:endonuclease/exonuclease/phosphatase family metal-dependent hydrolase